MDTIEWFTEKDSLDDWRVVPFLTEKLSQICFNGAAEKMLTWGVERVTFTWEGDGYMSGRESDVYMRGREGDGYMSGREGDGWCLHGDES